MKKFLKFENVTDLDLAQTLDCGQSFRWVEREDGGFDGVAFNRSVTVRLDGTDLYIENADESDRELWHSYFDLGLDYGKIRGIVQRLCEQFGDRLPDGTYAFPDAEKMASLTADDLAPLRAGFRNRYLVDAARKVADGDVDLEKCRSCDYDEARRELMQITGVGVKVADCALLFGLHRIEAFPLDVWMKRAMATLFPGMTPGDFGQYAGIAQQYIFHYSRMNPKLFEQT